MSRLVRVVASLLAVVILLLLGFSPVQAQTCNITQFSISATSVAPGTAVDLFGSGQCSSFRSIRFFTSSEHILEGTTPPSLSGYWVAKGSGNVSICMQITSGDWNNSSETATSCQNVFVSGGSDSGGGDGGGNPTNPDSNNGGSWNGGGSPSSQPCNSQPSYLSVGAIARVNQSVSVRDSVDGFRIEDLEPGKLITIIGGPNCRANLLVWNVGYDGKQGWVAEVSAMGTYYLVPNSGGGSSSGGGNTTPPTPDTSGGENGGGTVSGSCNPISRLQIGDLARVSDETPDPVPQRSDHSTSATVLQQISINELVIITGGPYCEGPFVWWLVRYNGITGWSAEVNRFNNHNLIWVESGEEENISHYHETFHETGDLSSPLPVDITIAIEWRRNQDGRSYTIDNAWMEFDIWDQNIQVLCYAAASIQLIDSHGNLIGERDARYFDFSESGPTMQRVEISNEQFHGSAAVSVKLTWECLNTLQTFLDSVKELQDPEILSGVLDSGPNSFAYSVALP